MKRTKRNYLSLAIKVLLSLFGAAIAFILMVVVINLPVFDEELHPELADILEPPEMPPVEQNAHIAMLGISADSSLNMIEAGSLFRQRLDEIQSQGNTDAEISDFIEILGSGYAGEGASVSRNSEDLSWWNALDRCDLQTDIDCLQRMGAQIENLRDNARFQLVTDRYRQLITLPYYIEPTTYATSFYNSNLVLWAGTMLLADTYRNQPDNFLDLLEVEMAFWVNVLTSQNNNLSKIIALTSIRRNGHLISEYIRENDPENLDVQHLLRILNMYGLHNISLDKWWEAQIASTRIYVENFNISWQDIFIQINASENINYRYYLAPMLELATFNPIDFHELNIQAKESDGSVLDCCRAELKPLHELSSYSLYNPLGQHIYKIVLDMISDSLFIEDYFYRFYNVAGLMDLLKVQLEIKTNPDSNPAEIVSASSYKSPYSGQAMSYDGDNRTLSFECFGVDWICADDEETGKRISVDLDPVEPAEATPEAQTL